MKLKITHPEPQPGHLVGPRYWRSLDEQADRPEFQEWLHREFPQGAAEASGVNRRHFLKIMAASFAVAGVGMTGCRRPEEHIMAYSKQPEGTIPGMPVYFSTAFPDALDALPLVVESHQNRPTHIEGNPKFAPYGGAVSSQAVASLLDLYDPDRLTSSYRGTARITGNEARDLINALPTKFAATGGQGLAVLAAPSSSATRRRVQAAFAAKYPRAVWVDYAAGLSSNPEQAHQQVFGEALRALPKYEAAKCVLALDADFLQAEAGHTGATRAFAKTRKVKNKDEAKSMSRLYAVEGEFSLTGSMADHRLRLGSSQVPAFTALLGAAILEKAGANSASFAGILRSAASGLQVDSKWIEECAADLVAQQGKALIVAGRHQPVAVHALVALLNEVLDAPGATLEYAEAPAPLAGDLAALVADLKSGKVDTLLVLGGNPAFDAPADLGLAQALKKVPQVIRLGYHWDETSAEAHTVIAASHYLEQWSDARAFDGTYFPVQPLILPLFDTLSELEFLARAAGLGQTDALELVRETFRKDFNTELDAAHAFRRLLAEGVLPGSAYRTTRPRVALPALKTVLGAAPFQAPALAVNNLEIRLTFQHALGDGRYANNGWLQELPDPMTRLTWDNAIVVSPALAQALGFDTKSGEFLIGGIAKSTQKIVRAREHAPLAELTVDGITITGPLHILPGLADHTVVVPAGYGRRQVGRVGQGTGFDAYPLSHSASPLVRVGGSLRLTGEERQLANVQAHWSMEGRDILREANVDFYEKNPDWVMAMSLESHSPAIYGKDKDMAPAQKALSTPRGNSAYEHPDFGVPPPNVAVWKQPGAMDKFVPEQQWGMSIDLNACTGCTACVVACQSENNIPIVGKDQVMRGREMSWIRLDRYFSSGEFEKNRTELPADPQASIMPVGCLHCETAPCEQVCPVNATVHDSQGLNVMAYNRCVGTRYCANNCPYKVRRFNFFDYNKRATDEFYAGPLGTNKYKTDGAALSAMRANPDVTIRMRGVMEKCTFCVQRIEQAKIAQRVKAKASNDIHIPDGVLKTACQTACPAEAIVFGDVSNPESAVSKAKANDRDYALLGYLNTRPRTTYLARLRNPNPRMPDYKANALSYLENEQSKPSHGAAHGGESHGTEPAANAHGH